MNHACLLYVPTGKHMQKSPVRILLSKIIAGFEGIFLT
jgi:hypothetical protein